MKLTRRSGKEPESLRSLRTATRDLSRWLEVTGRGRIRGVTTLHLASALAILLVIGGFVDAGAAGTPEVPPPSACTIAPRQIPATGGGAPTVIITAVAPLPAPFTPPAGSPAASDAGSAVSATIREAIACANGGDIGRSLALLSDGAFAAYLSGPNALDRGILTLAPGTSTPASTSDQLTLVSIDGITLLRDGRIGATVVTRNRLATYTDFVILVFEHNHWLIDESVPISTVSAGSPPATP